MKKLVRSFGYAATGIMSSISEQRNLKIQLSISLVVIGAGFYFSIGTIEWCILLLCMTLVISLEMVNTSIENLVNLVTQERQPLAGKIKDIAAGAVLVAAVITSIIGLCIFIPYLRMLL